MHFTNFNNPQKTHKKVYATSAEEKKAQNNYEKTMKENEIHNSDPNKTYTRGETADTDKSYDWKLRHRMGIKKPEKPPQSSSVLPKMLSKRMEEIPESADWSPWDSPVKDQSELRLLQNFKVSQIY